MSLPETAQSAAVLSFLLLLPGVCFLCLCSPGFATVSIRKLRSFPVLVKSFAPSIDFFSTKGFTGAEFDFEVCELTVGLLFLFLHSATSSSISFFTLRSCSRSCSISCCCFLHWIPIQLLPPVIFSSGVSVVCVEAFTLSSTAVLAVLLSSTGASLSSESSPLCWTQACFCEPLPAVLGARECIFLHYLCSTLTASEANHYGFYTWQLCDLQLPFCNDLLAECAEIPAVGILVQQPISHIKWRSAITGYKLGIGLLLPRPFTGYKVWIGPTLLPRPPIGVPRFFLWCLGFHFAEYILFIFTSLVWLRQMKSPHLVPLTISCTLQTLKQL